MIEMPGTLDLPFFKNMIESVGKDNSVKALLVTEQRIPGLETECYKTFFSMPASIRNAK